MTQLAQATVTVDLAKITANARTVCDALPGIEIIGVTKVTCGSPQVARAMLAGGVAGIGESRLENIARLRVAGIDAPFWLLRAPTPALAEETVRLADLSLVSAHVTAEALDEAARRLNTRHRILVMVDVGDLREGLLPDELAGFLERVAALAHIDIAGIGTSLTCYGAVVPSQENLGELVELAEGARSHIAAQRDGRSGGERFIVSGGMSSSLELALLGRMPAGVDNLRVGESILLGLSTVTRRPIPGLHTGAIVLDAPVIECGRKPSTPRGEIAQDAFGRRPVFEDRGERWRAICAIGRQDVVPRGIRPVDPGIEVLGASSDHLVLDIEDATSRPAIGEPIRFSPDYSATLRLFTSPYVKVDYVGA
ncbi:MAG: alanine/ornithine racemase family PLP-dependent enzyme [Clostridiales bacterium]|nr:alanine/ornithine racemase family PLP-dependent enzyme [Clostridiales bacterium]